MEATSAAFKFVGFKIPLFRYCESEKRDQVNLKIDFQPTGRYYKADKTFEITLDVIGIDEDTNKEVLFVQSLSSFVFESQSDLADLPPYFYRNAIAIIYPYLRSFVSTLTLQANAGILILGLLNLSSLEGPLRKNTIEV